MKKWFFKMYVGLVIPYAILVSLIIPSVFRTSTLGIMFSVLYALLFEKYNKNIPDVMLWVDEYLNHGFFEYISSKVSYSFWNHTSYAFCQWVCDNFETFDGEEL